MTLTQLSIDRFFGVPPGKLWANWTQKGLLQKWLGLKGSTVDVAHCDVRQGGHTLSIFAFPDEPLMRVKFTYLEIDAPKKLTWMHSFVDAEGNTVRHPFNAAWPLQTLITVTFDHALAEQTRVTLTWTPRDASDDEQKAFSAGIASMQSVWENNFEQLAKLIASEKNI